MTLLGWSFAAPALLWGLLALPILWLILRAMPPPAQRRRFPAVVLLLGLDDRERRPDRTPWWLLLLRALAVAAALIGFAGPLRAPQDGIAASYLPLVIVMDGGWGQAHDWARQRSAALDALALAGQAGRRVALLRLTDTPAPPPWQSADSLRGQLAALAPLPHAPTNFEIWAKALPQGDSFDTLWFSDGLNHKGRGALVSALLAKGKVEVSMPTRPLYALAPATYQGGDIILTALRLPAPTAAQITLRAMGPSPTGAQTELARISATFAAVSGTATARLSLPPELRARITRFEIEGQASAAAISLTDDALLRRKVAIIATREGAEGLQLLSPTHYVTTALAPSSDLIRGSIAEVLPSNPDAIILADLAKIGPDERENMLKWITAGGTLLRFAGPQLAAAELDADAQALLPVRLRSGGRSTGGAMTWGDAKTLAPFAANGPFAGLTIGPDVTVTAQVLAEPDPDLAQATLAALADGTPLVTRRKLGAGQIVLFHVTANAEWSSLPLSGLFVQMLERMAVASRTSAITQAEVAASLWQAQQLTDAFGTPAEGGAAGGGRAGISGADMWAALQMGPSGAVPAGLYAGEARSIALNTIRADDRLAAFSWPAAVTLRGADAAVALNGKGPLLALAMVLLMLDIIAALALGGKLGKGGVLVLAILGLLAWPAPPAQAQTLGEGQRNTSAASDFAALRATRGVVLAHVLTGDAKLDDIAQAGLQGLSDVLTYRTSIEPDPPVGVDIETDDLEFYPFLYWPISTAQALPSPAALAKLNRFLRTGGMIMFDTRSGDAPDLGGPAENMLRLLVQGLDIPPLDPVPQDHVLTRSFYLIDGFPGRYEGAPVWVEASTFLAEPAQSDMPFRPQNDGVTPVIIGGNDWAGAWAVDDYGAYLLPVGRGFEGERQREFAYRFGVNVIMHVLTGNYKSDQVHVPALLDRLGP